MIDGALRAERHGVVPEGADSRQDAEAIRAYVVHLANDLKKNPPPPIPFGAGRGAGAPPAGASAPGAAPGAGPATPPATAPHQ